MSTAYRFLLSGIAGLWAAPWAAAQEASGAPAQPPPERIVVAGEAERGTVIGDVVPDVTFDAGDISALGSTSLGELIDDLAPEVGGAATGDDPPVILLNGQRIASFNEIRGFPSEAVVRVEVLPEEVALAYGYSADRRVVNIVLETRFTALTLGTRAFFRTAGAGERFHQTGGYLRIRGDHRWGLEALLEVSNPILESDRDLIPGESRYSLDGNVFPGEGSDEIDPDLSALVGEPVVSAAFPAGAGAVAPSLADFRSTANIPGSTNQQRYNALHGKSERLDVSGSYNRPLGPRTQGGVSLALDLRESNAPIGLPEYDLVLPAANTYSPFSQDVRLYRLTDAFGAMQSQSETNEAELGASLRYVDDIWQVTLTANAKRRERTSEGQRSPDTSELQARIDADDPSVNPFSDLSELLTPSVEYTRSTTTDANLNLTANRTLLELPSGDLTTSLTLAHDHTERQGQSQQADRDERSELARGVTRLRGSLDVPVVASWWYVPLIERLSLNLRYEAKSYSDFGDLSGYRAGFNWSVIEGVRLSGSVETDEFAPSIGQLGDPLTITPNRTLYDYVNGESILVTRFDGGNPDLVASQRDRFRLGARLEPFQEMRLSLRADYTDSKVNDPARGLPTPTAAVEAAFPDRFVRGSAGRLVSFDNRPVNFDRSDWRELRWGVNYTKEIFASTVEGDDADAESDPVGRFYTSLNHRWRLEDRLVIRPELPDLDFLNGAPIGSRGGRPEHALYLRAGYSSGGVGARVDLDWRSGSEVDAGSAASAGDLTFSELTTVRTRFFYNVDQQSSLARHAAWLEGGRFALTVHNLFDEKPRVRNALGETPISYQPDELDAGGRTIEIEFRKQFS